MSERCPEPHPLLDANGGYVSQLEVIVSHATDAAVQCRQCGAYLWTVVDLGGKYEYVDSWRLDAALAQAAFVEHDARALARLFVTMNLPYGPLWTLTAALVELFRALTPGISDAERVAALDAAGAHDRWTEAARLIERDAHAVITSHPLAFDVDVRVPGAQLREVHEVGDAVVLLTDRADLMRVDRRAVVQLPLAGVPQFLARGADRLMLSVAGGIAILDADGNATAWPGIAGYDVTALDDGWWMFAVQSDGPDTWLELRRPDGSPRAKVRYRFVGESRHVPAPRRFGDGWMFSNLVDDDGATRALVLMSRDFAMLAASERDVEPAARHVTPIDETACWASVDGAIERWIIRDRTIERVQRIPARASWIVGDALVVDAPGGEVASYARNGTRQWSWTRATTGATYGTHTRRGVLVYDDTKAHLLDANHGRVVRAFDVESPTVLGAEGGVVYVKTGADLWIVHDDAHAIAVGLATTLETTCGTSALLRRSDGLCIVVDASGRSQSFRAPDARFSVVGMHGGPWVLEGDRVRGVFAKPPT
ncbi:MAG: hypothetical protein JO257_08245 [Deltaproteobacteria bacterium]|nr:hypothetical protein [Deltaproteobacteria bacterium]